jgi:predicted RNA-binding Zn-ribbon protein involved in translation (DUF1610 family)
MKCSKCDKELTEADIPEYTNLAILQAEPKLYFLCKPCRDLIEKAKEDVIVKIAIKEISQLIMKGATVWIKFTCHNCGSRQTGDIPNRFYAKGYTCEECKKVTFPDKIGWSMMYKVGGEQK